MIEQTDIIHQEKIGKLFKMDHINGVNFSGRYREDVARQRAPRRESYQGSRERGARYPPPEEFRDRRYEQPRERDERMYQERPSFHRMESAQSRSQRDSNRYRRDPYENYPPPEREMYRPEREQYREPSPQRPRYESPRNAPMSQREQVSKVTGIPKDFIKSDAATKPGVGYQAKPSEIRYHFYIICLDCKYMPVTKVKDLILKELEQLGYRLNKEAVYVDDKDLPNDYKALVGFKFDHIALKCYDSLERMRLPFQFKKELSRTFQAYFEKYENVIKKIAYPSDPSMCPNQKIRRDSGKFLN